MKHTVVDLELGCGRILHIPPESSDLVGLADGTWGRDPELLWNSSVSCWMVESEPDAVSGLIKAEIQLQADQHGANLE